MTDADAVSQSEPDPEGDSDVASPAAPVSDFLAKLHAQEEQQAQAARQALAGMRPRLIKLGVETVSIAYDGYGDSGGIESIQATRGEVEFELPNELREALEDAAENLLPLGWENNDGAFGEFVLDVAEGRLTREHAWRTTECDADEWEL